MDAGGKERFHLWLQCFECKSTEQKEAARVESEQKNGHIHNDGGYWMVPTLAHMNSNQRLCCASAPEDPRGSPSSHHKWKSEEKLTRSMKKPRHRINSRKTEAARALDSSETHLSRRLFGLFLKICQVYNRN